MTPGAGALLLLVVSALGWVAGVRVGTGLGHRANAAVSKFDDASMALLSLLLGFTFGMSMNWHNDRRMAVIADSNSIGDFYTCAALLPEPNRSKLQSVVREYAQSRYDLAVSRPSTADLDRSLQKFEQMQSQMTDIVRDAVAQGTPIAVSLTNTLNALTSNHASRLAAIRIRLPNSILILLFVASAATTFLIGREQGLNA